MNKQLYLLALLFLPMVAVGKTIELECTFRSDLSGAVLEKIQEYPDSDYLRGIQQFATQKKRHQFWLSDSKLLFSIDLDTHEVHITSYKQSPSLVIELIEAIVTNKDYSANHRDDAPYLDAKGKLFADVHSDFIYIRSDHYHSGYIINRIDGGLSGLLYVRENEPAQSYLKVGDIKYLLSGQCKSIERLF